MRARNFLTDLLRSTIALADPSGTLQTQYSYDPFGNTSVSVASSANSYQFTGRENDETPLYYYRARYHQPGFQRFVAQDPLDFRGGDPNLYDYVRDNPISGMDPFGLASASPGGPTPSPVPTPIPTPPPRRRGIGSRLIHLANSTSYAPVAANSRAF